MSSVDPYLKLMAEKEASDLFFTTGAAPSIKIQGVIRPVSKSKLEPGMVKRLAYSLLNDHQVEDFEDNLELNLGLSRPGCGRFRVNIYMQRGEVSMVIRFIKSKIPKIEDLNLAIKMARCLNHDEPCQHSRRYSDAITEIPQYNPNGPSYLADGSNMDDMDQWAGK